jgi:hypothetical protein
MWHLSPRARPRTDKLPIDLRSGIANRTWPFACFDERTGAFSIMTTTNEVRLEQNEGLLLIDDVAFVKSYVAASNRLGVNLICVRCADPTHALRALVLLLDTQEEASEIRGSLGLCRQCYRDLSELMFHDAVLRASTSGTD